MCDDIQKVDDNHGQIAQTVHGDQIFNGYTIINPKIKKYPVIAEPIKIAIIHALIYNLAMYFYISLFIICLYLVPLSIYSHIYNINNMFTITSSEHQIGYLLMCFYYMIISFIVLVKIIFPFFAKLSVNYYKEPILTNDSFNKINFSYIRKLTISHNLLRNKLYLYQLNKPRPIVYIISDFDDMLLINDAFEGYINSDLK